MSWILTITTVWLQLKLFLLLLSEMSSVDFKFFFVLSAPLWWGSHYIACNSSIHGCNLCSASFLKGWNRLFREGTKVQSKNFSTCHQILESHLKEERLPLRKEKRLFSGHRFCSSEKKPRCCNIFQGRILSQMEEETLTSRKGRYLGFRGSAGKGWCAPGSESWSSLLGAGESSFRRKKWLPLGEVPTRPRLPDPRGP